MGTRAGEKSVALPCSVCMIGSGLDARKRHGFAVCGKGHHMGMFFLTTSHTYSVSAAFETWYNAHMPRIPVINQHELQ